MQNGEYLPIFENNLVKMIYFLVGLKNFFVILQCYLIIVG